MDSERLPRKRTGMYYHGTHMGALEDIRREGLRCACKPGMGATAEYKDTFDSFGCVCLTDVPKKARFYAVVTTRFTKHLPEEEMLIVEVDPNCLEPSMLTRRISSEGKVSHEFDYKLRIPPECLHFYRWDPKLRDYVFVDLPPRSDW